MKALKYEIQGDGSIVSLRPGPWGGPGAVGGYVDGPHNLSQDGDCWILRESQVRDDAIVRDSAAIYGGSLVRERWRSVANGVNHD